MLLVFIIFTDRKGGTWIKVGVKKFLLNQIGPSTPVLPV